MFVLLLLLTGNTIKANAQDAKFLANNGWIVEPGTKSIAEQLKQVTLAKQDSTVIVGEGYYVADTYHEAYYKAYLKALHDASKHINYWMQGDANKNPEINNIDSCSESAELRMYIIQEYSESDSYNRWDSCSDAKIEGNSYNVTRDSCIESKWCGLVYIESTKIIKSIYRHNQNGKIEIELSLTMPNYDKFFEIYKKK